ncbi:TetR/AcrR family transcriptional regulator [Lactiplantibacillus plantarum]|uniref:TetR/AcrR family transcriptional regulator n=1 Tax=Lactiplantibacillus plantarum TaxID=1590 RepID=UPI001C1F6D97|nr:TetR/AcrR family transcriptional regulator [Lactiplantibacillus plantarum]MBU7472279.1 TetR/AcrR family transcriptional regulator [Lactiplantibacillus plantarum]
MEHGQFKQTDHDIWNAFFELLKQEKFTVITVGQICNIAKISRTTFYRHYVDKYALLDKINRHYSNSLACFLKERLGVLDIKQALVKIAQFLSENSKRILILLDIHTPESDLSELFKETLHNEFANHINTGQTSEKIEKFPEEYLTELYVAVSMVFLSYSLKNGLDVNIISSLNDVQNVLFN